MFRRVRIGAHQQDTPVGILSDTGPDFCPLTTKSSPSRTALVCNEARSEPELGSENPWHQISSALRILGIKRFFCSSVPWWISVGPTMPMPSPLAGCGARARAISWHRWPAGSTWRPGRRTPWAS